MGNVSTKDLQGGRTRKNVHWRFAERPSLPGKPCLVSNPSGAQGVTLTWDPPRSDGGTPLTGYCVEQRITGSPHWVPTLPDTVTFAEITPAGLEAGRRYQFRVSASNAKGYSEFSEPSEPLTITISGAVCPPAFLAELRDATVAEGDKSEFEARVLGAPTPAVAWFKDGFEIFSSRRARILTEENRSILTIHQTALSDEGEIKCSATNHAGHAVTRARLKVEAPPGVRLPRRYEEGLLFEAGEVMRLKVAVAGRPAPRITWTHDGEPIKTQGLVEIENGDLGLRIKSASRSDRGEYRIHAINALGEDSASFLVTVTDKPRPPSRPIVTMTLGKSVTLAWREPEDDGGCKIGNYIVEYYRTGWDVWLKAAASRQLSATISDLLEGSEYKFRVKAENPYGLSEPSESSEPLFVPDQSRGITRLQEMYVPTMTAPPPVAPRRKRSSSKSSLSEDKTMHVKNEDVKMTNVNSDIESREAISTHSFDRASLARELSYGSPDSIYKKRSSANLDLDEEKRRSTHLTPAALTAESISDGITVSTNLLRRPSSPRDNDDELQGSSEFMLVLYPDKNEKDNLYTYEFEEDTGAPPPLSLSNPELGTQPVCVPTLRCAISSTELLYERAMQRFYRAAVLEQRYSRTGSEPGSLNSSFRRRPSGEQQKLLQLQERSWNIEDDRYTKASPQLSEITGVILNGTVHTSELEKTQDNIVEIDSNRNSRARSVEDDYTDSTASSDMESQDERFKILFKKIRSLEDDEENTYHPRSMQPMNSQAAEILTKPAPIPDPDFVPKPILKRQPGIIENKRKIPPAKPERQSLITKSKKDPPPIIHVVPPEERSDINKNRKNKPGKRRDSEEEAKVVIDHYSDLVKQITGNRRYTENQKHEIKSGTESKEDIMKDNALEIFVPKPRNASKSPVRASSASKQITVCAKNNELNSHMSPGNPTDNSHKIAITKIETKQIASAKSRRSESRSPSRRSNDRVDSNIRTRNTSKTRKRSESRSPTRIVNKQKITLQQNDRWQSKGRDISKAVIEANVRSAFSYLTDVAIFILACWLYAFKDARLAIPVLTLMLYRQIGEFLQKKYPSWMIKKK